MTRSSVRILRGASLLALTTAVIGCASSSPPVAETPPPPVTVSQPVVRDVTDHDDYEGRLAAAEKVEIRARARGHLIKVNFQDGQMVKVGDLLYEIDPRQHQVTLTNAEAQVASAQGNLEFARAEYNRVRGLVQKRAASPEELDAWTAKQALAQGDISKAKAAVAQAKLDLEYTKVTAPIAGRISRTQVDVGNLVNAGGGETLLTTLVSVEPIHVYFNIDERSLLRYRKDFRKQKNANGTEPPIKELKIPVFVALEGEEGYPHQGVIDFADNRVNPSTGTIQVRGVLSNAKRIFEDGMRARVRVPVSDPYKALMVTERAVGTEQGRKFVYVVNDKNEVERRDVTLDRVVDGLQVVRDGLKPDDWVVVNGIQRVRDAMKVAPRRAPRPGAPRAPDPAPKTTK
ncbi:MAG: efflux RND transporter periplasmic adaptor subunit [Gemmataceae bacterium]